MLPSKSISVVAFSSMFHPHIGGVERFNRELCQEMVSRGWKMVLITSRTDQESSTRELIDGIDVIRLPSLMIIKDRYPLPLPSLCLMRVLIELWRRKPFIGVTNTRFSPLSWLGAIICKIFRVPLIHIEHGASHVQFPDSRIIEKIGKLIDFSLGRLVIKSATSCFAVSQAARLFSQRIEKRTVDILPNGVSVGKYTPQSCEKIQHLQLPDQSFVVLFLGRVVREKGIFDLLQTFSDTNLPPNIHLVIAGNGPDLELVKQNIAPQDSRIHCLGQIRSEEVPALISCADIIAHPSHCAEGLPTVILEAGASGKAVIATKVGGWADVVPDNQYAELITAGDIDALRNAIIKLYQDKEHREALGAKLKQHVKNHFDWPHVADIFEAELLQLIKSRI